MNHVRPLLSSMILIAALVAIGCNRSEPNKSDERKPRLNVSCLHSGEGSQ